MPADRGRALIALSGVLGVAMLTAHFFIPAQVPPDTAPAGEVIRFAAAHHDAILLTAWLQGVGPLLYVVFALTVVHLAGATARPAGVVTLLASAVILTLSLLDAALTVSATDAAVAGQVTAATVSFDLIAGPANDAVGRAFLLAPPLLLPMGAALLGSDVLPRRAFGWTAVAFGAASLALGLAQLYSAAAFDTALYLIIAQNLWVLAAAVALVVRGRRTAARTGTGAAAGSLV